MKKLLLLIFLFLSLVSTNAQEVIGSAGGTLSTTGGSIEYTLGELIVSTISDASNALTQGFQQPSLTTLSVDEFEKLNIKIYPNPAMDFVNIKLLNFDNLTYSLFDIQGRRIQSSKINNRFASLNLQHLSQGVYILRVGNDDNQKQKSYRIIKN